MSVRKGVNNFKKMQQEKLNTNKQKIEKSFVWLGSYEASISLSKFISSIADIAGLHPTTIHKNKIYYNICKEHYINNLKKYNKEFMSDDENMIEDLKLDNLELEKQIDSLTNTIKKLENKIPNFDYESAFNEILKHFKDKIEFTDGKVFDISTKNNKIVIYDLFNIS